MSSDERGGGLNPWGTAADGGPGRPALQVCAELAEVAGPLLAAAIRDCIGRTGRCRLGLSGGSTPGATLQHLARELIAADYAGLWVTWVDERRVPLDHPDSNHRLAREAWLDQAAAPPAEVLPLDEAAAPRFLSHWGAALDVVLLGAGPDGHIASLFPGHSALEQPGPVIEVNDSPKPPPRRFTLSLSVLQDVDHVILLARGAAKATVLAGIWAGDDRTPLGRLQPRGSYHWVLDRAAAEGIAQ
jgi:6-phosphogluconolactonase